MEHGSYSLFPSLLSLFRSLFPSLPLSSPLPFSSLLSSLLSSSYHSFIIQCTFVYQGVDSDVRVSYTVTNSEGGIEDIEAKRVDFAGSDVLQIGNLNGIKQLPIAGI